MTPELKKVIADLTCGYCAGEGGLATLVNKTFAGSVYTEERSVRECQECAGTGITPPPIRRLG